VAHAEYIRGVPKTIHFVLGLDDDRRIRKLVRRLRNSEVGFSDLCRLLLILGLQRADMLLAARVPVRDWEQSRVGLTRDAVMPSELPGDAK